MIAKSKTSTRQHNKEIVSRLMTEAFGAGRVDRLPELIASTYVAHLPIGDHFGLDGIQIEIAALRRAIPDLTVTVDELIAEADQVARRYTVRGRWTGHYLGQEPTRQPVEARGFAIDRIAGGRIVESWVSSWSEGHDDLGPGSRGPPR